LVAIDKFSKWVEVRPITNLRAEQAVTFFTDIFYRFGVPNSINTDNGVGVLDRQTYQGVPEVVDCAVRIMIGRPKTRRCAQGH
jgi:hypothetical protein